MKRKIFKSPMTAALSVVMLIGCVLVLTGCGKKPANELDGTKWIATYIVDSGGMPYTGAPTVERYDNKMIEIRTSSGVLFRYEPKS